MFNLDIVTSKNDNKTWPYRMLMIVPTASGKTNALFYLIQQDNNNLIDKIYYYIKDLDDPKYKFLLAKRKQAGIKNLNGHNAFIEYWKSMDNVYDNIDDYNPKRKRKVLIVFDGKIVDIMTNKKF